MLTAVILVLIGIALVHVLADATKAAVIVVIVAGIFYLARGVSFEALVDEGARALFDHPSCTYHHPGRRI